MEPALVPGDQVSLATGTTARLKRGDVVVFEIPTRYHFGTDTMIKRIVGLPGESIASSGATVLINGVPLSEPYLSPSQAPGPPIAEQVIPRDAYFMLGDNRTNSLDSRFLGPIPATAIIGIAERIVAPASRSGPVPGSPG